MSLPSLSNRGTKSRRGHCTPAQRKQPWLGGGRIIGYTLRFCFAPGEQAIRPKRPGAFHPRGEQAKRRVPFGRPGALPFGMVPGEIEGAGGDSGSGTWRFFSPIWPGRRGEKGKKGLFYVAVQCKLESISQMANEISWRGRTPFSPVLEQGGIHDRQP